MTTATTATTLQSARLAAAEDQLKICSSGHYIITATDQWRVEGDKLARLCQGVGGQAVSLLDFTVLFAPGSARVIRCGFFNFCQALHESEGWQPLFSKWRHGGWYISNIVWPEGGCGCVSRNYEDGKWRIVCDPRRNDLGAPGDFTYASRTQAAMAERALIAEQARALLHKVRCSHPGAQLISSRLVCDKNGYQDFDIEGLPSIRRACVPNGIKVGQQFNVYHDETRKSVAIWTGTLEASLRKFAAN